jgi:hypothetical protein
MRDPHVRFCERHGGVISRAYSTPTVVASPPASPELSARPRRRTFTARDKRNRCERTPCETYARAGMMAAVRYGGGSDERRGVEWRWRGERALLD